MESVNQTRPHCVNQMGKTHSKPLAARHGRGMAWVRHGHSMLCVNRPLLLLLHESYHFFRKSRYICSELTAVKLRNKTRVKFFVKYDISQSGILICLERNSTGIASNSRRCVEPLLKQATILKSFMVFRVIYYQQNVSEIIYQGISCNKTGRKNVSAVLNINQKIWVS